MKRKVREHLMDLTECVLDAARELDDSAVYYVESNDERDLIAQLVAFNRLVDALQAYGEAELLG